jgi:hypothetical protein
MNIRKSLGRYSKILFKVLTESIYLLRQCCPVYRVTLLYVLLELITEDD